MPPASTMNVQHYCNLLMRSQLMSPENVKDSFRRWSEGSKSGSDETESFRKFLVARKLLTDYQSHLLMRGHSDGFFLDRYKILELISKGSMAGVYKALHSSGQTVAIKVLPPSKAKNPTVLARFQREGKMLTKLNHPNVARAFQIGEAGGKHYFVMEHLDGEPLEEILQRRKRLPVGEAVRLAHQALLGLQHVFEKGMIHRDLKPANLVLVPPTGGPNETTFGSVLRILDIGLGRSTFDETTREPDEQLTTEGTLLGSPDYLAPEQARSAHDADIRADIYSMGCVLYHMLVGQPPFPAVPGESLMHQIVKLATEEPRPLADFLPQVPEGLQQVLNWMLAKDPNQRYPTPGRAAQALQMFLPKSPEVAANASGPLPAYVDYLQSSGHIDLPKPAGPAIPVGRLEADPRRKEHPAEKKLSKSGTASAPAVIAPPSTATDGDYDVEIVAAPPPSPVSSKKSASEDEPRGLLELDRRDYIMTSIGAGIVLLGLSAGYGVYRLVRRTPASPTTGEEEATVTPPSKTKQPVPSEEKPLPEEMKQPEEKKE